MSVPYIHGTCKRFAPDGNVTTVHKEDRTYYGGLRHYAECELKHKTVDGNAKACKHWECGVKEGDGTNGA